MLTWKSSTQCQEHIRYSAWCLNTVLSCIICHTMHDSCIHIFNRLQSQFTADCCSTTLHHTANVDFRQHGQFRHQYYRAAVQPFRKIKIRTCVCMCVLVQMNCVCMLLRFRFVRVAVVVLHLLVWLYEPSSCKAANLLLPLVLRKSMHRAHRGSQIVESLLLLLLLLRRVRC
jgi:hypothetical protein